MIALVVQHGDLVAAVEHGHAAEREHQRVQGHVQPHRRVQGHPVPALQRRLHAAEGGGGAAEAGVAQARVVVVELTAGGAPGPLARQVVVQVLLVGHLALAELAQEVVIQAPADVVMAAQVVEEGVLPRQGEHLGELVLQQARVPGGHGVPDGGHGGDVVEHVALGLEHRAEIGHHLVRGHDHLAQQQRARADDLAGHAHHAHQGVHLRQVPSRRITSTPRLHR